MPRRTRIPPPQDPGPRRLLAIDPGTHRTGIAVSDELGMLAHPRPAISGAGDAVVEAITALVREEGIAEVVVGLPLSLSGGDSAQTQHARGLIARLRQALPVPVGEWDERLTSVQAGRTISSRDRASGRRDSAAAALLLQSVIDSRRVRS